MPEATENPLSIQQPEPSSWGPAMPRRRKSAPLGPRRSPGDLAGAAPDAAPGEAHLQRPVGGGIAAGVAVLRAALRNVPNSAGVYRMLDRKGDALYVGKARNLKSRIQNYTHPGGLSNRLRRMVAETAVLEIVVTATEAEARRQILSVYPPDGRSRFPAAYEIPRRARQGGRVFRAVRLGRRRQPHAD